MRASKTKFIIKKSYYSRFVMGFFVFMGSLMVSGLVASVFAPVSDSSAQTISVENRATGYYVSVTSPASVSLDVSPTPAGSSVVSSASTVNVKTNAPAGYKLYLSTENDELVSLDASIAQTFSPVTSSALSANTWGYSLDSGTSKSWSAVPEVASSSYHPESAIVNAGADLISSSSAPNTPSGSDINVYYGVNADTSMPAGTYTTTVTYTAFAEGIPTAYTMQGFTIADCANMETDTTTVLTDTRNGNNYTIVKARDGNCWMADNLSIYDQTISSADSNLPEGTTITLPASSDWDNDNTYNTTNFLIHVANGTGDKADKTNQSGAWGEVYYNWCVSIGEANCSKYNVDGTTINQSICPKGWRLPVYGDTSQDKSWAKLMNAYGVTTGAQLMDSNNPAYILGLHSYYGYWAPYYYSEASQSENSGANFFWSSTAKTGNYAYDFSIYPGAVDPQNNAGKGHGFTVRCVQENRTLSDVTYMQDVYDQICANTATGATAQLLDKRGQGNNGTNTTAKYGVLKAKDGNCWMISNLNLYNKALTPNDTDIPSNITLPASSTWNTNVTNAMKIYVATTSGYTGEVYYNWCSSIGKTNCMDPSVDGENANQSICPKNWQLPLHGDKDKNYSYAKLMDSYKLTTSAQILAQTELGFAKYYGNWYFPWSQEINQGNIGSFWTDTAMDTSMAYKFIYGNNSNWYIGQDNKGQGFSIRCVLH